MDGLLIVIQTYISLVKSGKMKIDEIPDRYRERVKQALSH